MQSLKQIGKTACEAADKAAGKVVGKAGCCTSIRLHSNLHSGGKMLIFLFSIASQDQMAALKPVGETHVLLNSPHKNPGCGASSIEISMKMTLLPVSSPPTLSTIPGDASEFIPW